MFRLENTPTLQNNNFLLHCLTHRIDHISVCKGGLMHALERTVLEHPTQ